MEDTTNKARKILLAIVVINELPVEWATSQLDLLVHDSPISKPRHTLLAQ
jgi:hypothetical protein